MNKSSGIFDRVVLVILILFALGVCAFLVLPRSRPETPRAAEALPIISQIPAFTLTNQAGQSVTLANLRGKVWVADLIFTRCAGPCPVMTREMSQLQAALPESLPVKLVTFTTDPGYDTPPVLKAYGRRFGADFNRWMFLTGPKAEIATIAADGLKLAAVAKPAADRATTNDLFIHSTLFVVVDKQGRMRGAFETTGDGVNPDETRHQVVAAVETLARESYTVSER